MILLTLLLSISSVSADENPLKAVLKECYSADLDGALSADGDAPDLVVNGNVLTPTQAKNVRWFKNCVLPNLPGTFEEQVDTTAKVAWWSLREGNFDLEGSDLFRYSNCTEGKVDRRRSKYPLFDCPGATWQVGAASGQVKNYKPPAYIEVTERVFRPLSPQITEADVLAWTAVLAGYPEGSATYKAILRSKGDVKHSWLMRNPLIGSEFVAKEVQAQCVASKVKKTTVKKQTKVEIVSVESWCTGHRYPAETAFAENYSEAMRAIADLKRILSFQVWN